MKLLIKKIIIAYKYENLYLSKEFVRLLLCKFQYDQSLLIFSLVKETPLESI